MARQKNTVDYFPFFVKDGRTLYVLKKEYGLKGTGFFTELFRYLSQIPEHWTCLQDEYDRMRFLDFIGIDEKECREILNLMAETGKIDKELWIKKAIILSEDFLDSLDRVYSKRQNGLNAQTIKEKTEKIPALPGPDPAHQVPCPALPGLKGKERKGKERKEDLNDDLQDIPELPAFLKPAFSDSDESPVDDAPLEIPVLKEIQVRPVLIEDSEGQEDQKENHKILHKLTWGIFLKISPGYFTTENDKKVQGRFIKELIRDAQARVPTLENQKKWIVSILRTWLFICQGKLESFLNNSPFVASVLRSAQIWPRVLKILEDGQIQERIYKEMREPIV